MAKKIILDCDPGHDDAVALLLALGNPEIELIGVTTVGGNQSLDKVTHNARAVLEKAHATDIPVYAGCDRPIVRPQEVAASIHGETGLDGVELPVPTRPLEDKHAVKYIVDTIMNSEPGTITLVPTGPLTNIALACRLEPRIVERVKEVVLMGGGYHVGNWSAVAEFNIKVDPEAAHIVFNEPWPLTMVGLDLTHQALCTPEVEEKIKALGTEASEFVVGLMGFFRKATNSLDTFKAKYAKVETNVDKIEAVLEGHQVQLLKDIAMLDKMYEMNLVYFKELTMYILAGKKKLAEVRANELPALIEKAKKSGLPEDAQAAKDLDDMCTRFEKKLYDLELTRNISVQMSPQIRLIQSNDTMMAEKIQTSIVNTIPLWKSQMVLALGLAHSQQAIEAQRAVTDMTNELLKKNAATLKQGTIAAAKESERGIVDIETLQQTNRSLIETLDEVVKIQNEGREKRAAAETELGRIEGELKAKLLEIAR